jgi:predicted nucleic acid-binding Zn ribbon protein
MTAKKQKRYTREQWEVMRERCRIESPYPPPQNMQIKPNENVIANIMKKFGLNEIHWLSTLEEEWNELVGTAVATHTRPGKFENSQLTIYVDNSVWMYELKRGGQKIILNNLAKRYGKEKIKKIDLQLDPE